MLGKLIQFDFKSSYREFCAIMGAILLAAGMLCLLPLLQNTSLHFLLFLVPLAIVVLFVASGILLFLGIFNLYHKRIYTNEGHLTMALPVQSWQVLLSKLIVTMVWNVAVSAVAIAAFGGCFTYFIIYSGQATVFQEAWEVLRWVLTETPLLYVFLLLILVQTVSTILTLYCSTSIAYLRPLRRFKILSGIGAFYLINLLETVIMGCGILAFVTSVPEEQMLDIFRNLDSAKLMMAGVSGYLLALAALLAVYAVAKFFITNYLLRRHLELE